MKRTSLIVTGGLLAVALVFIVCLMGSGKVTKIGDIPLHRGRLVVNKVIVKKAVIEGRTFHHKVENESGEISEPDPGFYPGECKACGVISETTKGGESIKIEYMTDPPETKELVRVKGVVKIKKVARIGSPKEVPYLFPVLIIKSWEYIGKPPPKVVKPKEAKDVVKSFICLCTKNPDLAFEKYWYSHQFSKVPAGRDFWRDVFCRWNWKKGPKIEVVKEENYSDVINYITVEIKRFLNKSFSSGTRVTFLLTRAREEEEWEIQQAVVEY